MKKLIDNVENIETSTVKPEKMKPVKKVVEKVVAGVEKVEKEIKTKKTEVAAAITSQIDLEKKLYKSVTSKKKLYIEHYGKQVSEETIIDKLVERLRDTGASSDIKTLNIYYKAEEEIAYCVVNHGEPIVIKLFE